MRKRRLLAYLVAAALAASAQQPASIPDPKSAAVALGEVGSLLPDFTLKDLRGHPISSNDLKGKVVIIDFWSTWCAPCKQEMPGYQELIDRYGPQGLAVVGLKSDAMADTEDPSKFAKRIGVRYPLAAVTDDLAQRFGGIAGLPTTLIYDRSGVLRKKIIGFEYTEAVEAELKALL